MNDFCDFCVLGEKGVGLSKTLAHCPLLCLALCLCAFPYVWHGREHARAELRAHAPSVCPDSVSFCHGPLSTLLYLFASCVSGATLRWDLCLFFFFVAQAWVSVR